MRNALLVLFLFMTAKDGICQTTNTDPSMGLISVPLPKTPESSAFEKYGNTQVNELTGTPDISIPIYTIKSRFLAASVTLSYHPTGIKVNQEASWVGLGWDLIAGGRITIEPKGTLDIDGSTAGLYSRTQVANGLTKLFSRLGNSASVGIMTYGSMCRQTGCDTTVPDDGATMEAMDEFGAGQPDIFRANFLGHSLTFYFDKITGAIKFLGEQSLFTITPTIVSNSITGFTIVDNLGNTYYFNQAETTSITLPSSAITAPTSTSAWLLTKVQHPSGDNILFNYTNYGSSYPAFSWSSTLSLQVLAGSSASGITPTQSNDIPQNQTIQSPYYLTSIQSSDAEIDFILGSRTDIYGAGSQRLNQIKVFDRLTSTLKKTVTFSYDYFTASSNPCFSSLSSYVNLSSGLITPFLACYNQRLRLDSLNLNDPTVEPPYRFYYNSIVIDKYSLSQDHWGYYNGATNSSGGCAPKYLIPNTGLGTALSNTAMNGYAVSRDCNPSDIAAMTLDSIVYPTGGTTSFIFEPHQTSTSSGSLFGITGGGLRIKTINNYAVGGMLAGSTSYSYAPGVYNGTIEYYTEFQKLASCVSSSSDVLQYNLSANGTYSDNDILIAYPVVTSTQTNGAGQTNGYLVKTYNVPTPSRSNSGPGFNLQAAHWPTNYPNVNTTSLLYPYAAGLPPSPIGNLDNQLVQEQYFDSSNNLLKSVNYYYHQANYTQNFYDVRAIDNILGGVGGTCPSDGSFQDFEINGNRPVVIFVSPAKSYFTLRDSVIETTYSGSNSIRHKKAYLYNSYYQPVYESSYNSDSTQTITLTQTSIGLQSLHPLEPLGDALLVNQMQSAHIYDLPIEQTIIHRGVAGDSTVISSRLNIFQGPLPVRTYVMEATQPLTLRSQFVPVFINYPGYPGNPTDDYDTLKMDSHYVLYNTADYSVNNMIWTLHSIKGNTAYIWDETYNNVLAQCVNADSPNVAFTSFETGATGRWTYNASLVTTDNTAPTGTKVFALSTGNTITRASLTSATTYIVSYWSKTGSSYTVTGSTAVKQGKTINGWTYFEHTVSGITTESISGTGSIDEVRLYPSTAQMTTYTYSPLIGITSQCDADNRISYYFYDTVGRLKWIKDQDGNIIKTIQYHYQNFPGILF